MKTKGFKQKTIDSGKKSSSSEPSSAPSTYRIVRHLGNGNRQVIAEGFEMSPDEVVAFNQAMVRTQLRIWPVTHMSPLRSDHETE